MESTSIRPMLSFRCREPYVTDQWLIFGGKQDAFVFLAFDEKPRLEDYPSNEMPLHLIPPGSRVWCHDGTVEWMPPKKEENASQNSKDDVFAALLPHVECHKDRLGGKPTLKGTRFSVAQLLAEIADGRSINSIIHDFDLDDEPAKGVIEQLANYFDRSFVD